MINISRAYQQAYLTFKQQADQTFNNAKTLFDRSEAERNEVMEEAGDHGYGMKFYAYNPLNNDTATCAFKESLYNLSADVQANESEKPSAQKRSAQTTQFNAGFQ